jgi:selenocysteine lyase/cysteine desulfurase
MLPSLALIVPITNQLSNQIETMFKVFRSIIPIVPATSILRLESVQNLIEKVRQSVIGDRLLINTPYGEKPLIYADYTASGRALGFIEDYIQNEVLPFYANTHSESSHCGASMTHLRESAREVIGEAVNARKCDQVIFCGSGATAAIHKWIELLDLDLSSGCEEDKPVVLISQYEHHSNDLPWRELDVDLKVIGLTESGVLDLNTLENTLEEYKDRKVKIGSFSAASNVTGMKTDIAAVTEILKRYDALSCWDYAAAAPYVKIDMRAGGGLDAVFFSPHKFIGGPGTPGVLIVNEAVVARKTPTVPGGGTVTFVSDERRVYSNNLVVREEAGTPDIVGSIRAGMVMKVQQDVGTEVIESLESDFIKRAMTRLSGHPNIKILGSLDEERLSIMSFLIRDGSSMLHYGFVATLLNDLFGIQARDGCSCAGRYGHYLLDIDHAGSEALELAIANGEYLEKPGWIRINFNYFIDEATFEYLLNAIELIASYGHCLLSDYQYDERGGGFTHVSGFSHKQPCLQSGDFYSPSGVTKKTPAVEQISSYLCAAREVLTKASERNSPALAVAAKSA